MGRFKSQEEFENWWNNEYKYTSYWNADCSKCPITDTCEIKKGLDEEFNGDQSGICEIYNKLVNN